MNKIKLNEYEQEIENDIDIDFSKQTITKERRALVQQFAKNTFKKDKRINIRLSSNDLNNIQIKAAKEGMPYQTLISSIIHKYANGGIDFEKNEDRQLMPTN